MDNKKAYISSLEITHLEAVLSFGFCKHAFLQHDLLFKASDDGFICLGVRNLLLIWLYLCERCLTEKEL